MLPVRACRSGYIFPMLLCVREQPASEGPPAFVGIMRVINTTENHIVLDSEFVVTAASQASLALLDLEASLLTTSEIKITDFVGEWNVSESVVCQLFWGERYSDATSVVGVR